ncbi:MAG: heavy-metal-associated domain-containing protein [Prevotella sp.]|nr:heavy-metal-associated domain-containing protein [Prevotella sp.]
MKKTTLLLTMLLMAAVTFAKDIKTVVFTTQPQMHCESCENKIKGNLRFEKGIKNIETNVDEQAVTIQYDADKTNEEAIMKAFGKIGYQATKKEAAKKECCEKKENCDKCKAEGAEKAECCKEKKECGEKKECSGKCEKQ